MKFFPIMGDAYKVDDYAPLDLSVDSSNYYEVSKVNQLSLKAFVEDVKIESKAKLLYGGYLEHRAIYTSEHFTGESRDFHLGIDVWAAAGTPLYAPCDMVLHSMAYNAAELDYGYTLIYHLQDLDCHLLLGHLSKSSLDGKIVGMKVKAQSQLATLGDPSENGGWEPHVHIQLIKNMGEMKGDYPGVCTQSDLDYYRSNCPNPIGLILKE